MCRMSIFYRFKFSYCNTTPLLPLHPLMVHAKCMPSTAAAVGNASVAVRASSGSYLTFGKCQQRSKWDIQIVLLVEKFNPTNLRRPHRWVQRLAIDVAFGKNVFLICLTIFELSFSCIFTEYRNWKMTTFQVVTEGSLKSLHPLQNVSGSRKPMAATAGAVATSKSAMRVSSCSFPNR